MVKGGGRLDWRSIVDGENQHVEKPGLLLVEDDEGLRSQLKWALTQDYQVSEAHDRQSALMAFRREAPAVVLLDLGLPPKPNDVEEGFLTLNGLLEQDPTTRVIVITGQSERPNALRAIDQGAYDFLDKPVRLEELQVQLRRAFYVAQLEKESRDKHLRFTGEAFEGMVGRSPVMQEVFEKIRKVATSDAPVLIMGESGTGKELAAQAIHRISVRRKGPFVPINCGAIPENLLESELFGHEKGAFTGAHIQRRGRIELAEGGTLFLDEVGDLSLHLQVKILRFLQDKRIERIGGRETIQVDVRILAATNKDLEAELGKGGFREDLYYRLGVVKIALPPLRDREDDVKLLAEALFKEFKEEGGKHIKGFSPQALDALAMHDWPGNVRELENRIRRAVIMTEGGYVTPEALELAPRYGRFRGFGLREAREDLEKELIEQALTRNDWNLSRAAAELGISRPTLYDLMEKLGIKK
jgi:two-component system NtrC family response regulator